MRILKKKMTALVTFGRCSVRQTAFFSRAARGKVF